LVLADCGVGIFAPQSVLLKKAGHNCSRGDLTLLAATLNNPLKGEGPGAARWGLDVSDAPKGAALAVYGTHRGRSNPIRANIAAILSLMGPRVLMAEDGFRRSVCSTRRSNLAIVDTQMPGMHGLDLVRPSGSGSLGSGSRCSRRCAGPCMEAGTGRRLRRPEATVAAERGHWMSLWVMQRREGGRVAIRIQHAKDRPRRLVFDDAKPDEFREEWRCSGCGGWFGRNAVTWVESGRLVGEVHEVVSYCARCLPAAR